MKKMEILAEIAVIFDISFRLLCPFAPFLTEELWQRIPKYIKNENCEESICVSRYPTIENVSSACHRFACFAMANNSPLTAVYNIWCNLCSDHCCSCDANNGYVFRSLRSFALCLIIAEWNYFRILLFTYCYCVACNQEICKCCF